MFRNRIFIVENAIVVPADRKGGAFGVLAADGTFIDASTEYVRNFGAVRRPDLADIPGPIPTVSGTYLYAGWMKRHFGHFMIESISRFWAISASGLDVDGVAFAAFAPRTIWQSRRTFRKPLDFFLNGLTDLPVTQPTRFERLIVADPAIGLNDRLVGSPMMREFLASLPLPAPSPDLPGKIYLTRSQLGPNKGTILGESHLEDLLVRQGYVPVALEQHPFEEQIRFIRSADAIISQDGTPMHMAAYFANGTARCAMIARRPGIEFERIAAQFEMLQGRPLEAIDLVEEIWVDVSKRRNVDSGMSLVGFAKLGKRLKECGFIDTDAGFDDLPPALIRDEIERRNPAMVAKPRP